MNANPSLLSILMNIKSQIKDNKCADVQTLEKNKEEYLEEIMNDKLFIEKMGKEKFIDIMQLIKDQG